MSAVFELFRVFLRLGLSSFGGPAAHLGEFRTEKFRTELVAGTLSFCAAPRLRPGSRAALAGLNAGPERALALAGVGSLAR